MQKFIANDPDLKNLSVAAINKMIEGGRPRQINENGKTLSPAAVLSNVCFGEIYAFENVPYSSMFSKGQHFFEEPCEALNCLKDIFKAIGRGEIYSIKPRALGTATLVLTMASIYRTTEDTSADALHKARLFCENKILGSLLYEVVRMFKLAVISYFSFPIDGDIEIMCNEVFRQNKPLLWSGPGNKRESPNYQEDKAACEELVGTLPETKNETTDKASYIIMLPEKLYQTDMYWSCKGWSVKREDAMIFATQHAAHSFFRPHSLNARGYSVVEA